MMRSDRVTCLGQARLGAWLPLLIAGNAFVLAAEAIGETARYQVTFEASWSAESHPVEFPPGPHFSGLIGGTHNASVQFWAPGEPATEGIESMAEIGSQALLSAEVQSAIDAGDAWSVITGLGIGISPGVRREEFEISDQFPLVTLVSMIAPSPDWFVGVHDLSLRHNDQWIGQLAVNLAPYDAGTDDGLSYTSPNADSDPPQPITQLAGFPFEGSPPLGTFTFLRLLVGDYDRNGVLDAADIDMLSEAVRTGRSADEYDLNQDRAVNERDRVHWIEFLRGTHMGDANLDGVFDSSDLIGVSQAGQYEDELMGNSTWATGDWSGDGEFTSTDLILALQAGGYETNPVAAGRPVPEPTCLWALGLLAVLATRRLLND